MSMDGSPATTKRRIAIGNSTGAMFVGLLPPEYPPMNR